jgi:hypothetical protein
LRCFGEQREQAGGDRVGFAEADDIVLASRWTSRWVASRLAWSPVRADAVYRPGVGEVEQHWVEDDRAVAQVAGRVVRRGWRVGDVGGQLDPFVMRQFGQPARQAQARRLRQEMHEFARDFPEPRRAQRPVTEEATAEALPACLAEDGAAYRKGAVDEALQVVEDQFAVHAHAARRHAGRAGERCGSRRWRAKACWKVWNSMFRPPCAGSPRPAAGRWWRLLRSTPPDREN